MLLLSNKVLIFFQVSFNSSGSYVATAVSLVHKILIGCNIYNSQHMEANEMSINRKIDKEVSVHTYHGIVLGHRKKWTGISWTEADELRVCYTEWSKSERKQYIYINAYIWNLEKCTEKCICRAGIDADVEDRLVDTVGEREGGMNWESSTDEHTTCEIYSWWESAVITRGAQPRALWHLEGWMWGSVGGRLNKEGVCVYSYGWFVLLWLICTAMADLYAYGWFVCLWLICILVWQKPTQRCKAVILQLKKTKNKKTSLMTDEQRDFS